MLGRFIDIHLLNLMNGSPHELPLRKVLRLGWGYPSGYLLPVMEINRTTLALLAEVTTKGERRTKLVAWDWRTGKIVCLLLSYGRPAATNPRARCFNTRVTIRVSARFSLASPGYVSLRGPGSLPYSTKIQLLGCLS